MNELDRLRRELEALKRRYETRKADPSLPPVSNQGHLEYHQSMAELREQIAALSSAASAADED